MTKPMTSANDLGALFADAEPLPDQSRGLNQPVLTWTLYILAMYRRASRG